MRNAARAGAPQDEVAAGDATPGLEVAGQLQLAARGDAVLILAGERVWLHDAARRVRLGAYKGAIAATFWPRPGAAPE
jgi:hypothetical protein